MPKHRLVLTSSQDRDGRILFQRNTSKGSSHATSVEIPRSARSKHLRRNIGCFVEPPKCNGKEYREDGWWIFSDPNPEGLDSHRRKSLPHLGSTQTLSASAGDKQETRTLKACTFATTITFDGFWILIKRCSCTAVLVKSMDLSQMLSMSMVPD